jgi:hypothetical protein
VKIPHGPAAVKKAKAFKSDYRVCFVVRFTRYELEQHAKTIAVPVVFRLSILSFPKECSLFFTAINRQAKTVNKASPFLFCVFSVEAKSPKLPESFSQNAFV